MLSGTKRLKMKNAVFLVFGAIPMLRVLPIWACIRCYIAGKKGPELSA